MPTIRTSRRLRLSLRRVVAIAGLTLSPAALTASSAAASPPSNDTLGAAFLPAAGRGTPSADNTRAPKEAGEPNHAGDGGGHSIWSSWTPSFSGGAPGSARRGKWVNEPSVEVAFQEESAAPGGVATLRFFTPARGVELQMFHAGVERIRTHGPDVMQGAGVAPRSPAREGAGRVARQDRRRQLDERALLRPGNLSQRPRRICAARRAAAAARRAACGRRPADANMAGLQLPRRRRRRASRHLVRGQRPTWCTCSGPSSTGACPTASVTTTYPSCTG